MIVSGPNLIIQPAGHNNLQTWMNFEHTILSPVPISTIRRYAGRQMADMLLELYPSGGVPTWGLKPNNQKKVWDKIRVGDSVLFVGDKKAFMSGTVAHKPLHNRELALSLWGMDERDGEATWEFIYFVDDLRKQNMLYADLSKLVGYGADNNYMSATVRDYEQSKDAFEFLGLESQTYSAAPSPDEPYKISFKDSFVADREVVTKARGEQKAFRNVLFGPKAHEKCGICLKVYPVKFLVTAHIKRREACSDEEKLDSNIVMPMCVFGCDALYEQGYIGVDINTKKIIITDDPNLPGSVHVYLVSVDGNQCSYVNDRTSAYFTYHNNQMIHTPNVPVPRSS